MQKALEFLTADAHCKPQIDMGQDTEARDNMKELYNGWEKLKKQKKNRDSHSEEECTLFEQMRDIDPAEWEKLGGFDVDILKTEGKFVYKNKDSKSKNRLDQNKKLFKQSPKLEYVERIVIPIGGKTEEGSDGLPLVDKRLGFQLAALPNSMMIMLCLELGSHARQAQFAVNASQICVSSIDSSMSEYFESKLKERLRENLLFIDEKIQSRRSFCAYLASCCSRQENKMLLRETSILLTIGLKYLK